MAASTRGRLFVFEGIDRSGKSTQASLLKAYLEGTGKRVEAVKFPERSTLIGSLIDQYLKGTTEGACRLDDHAVHLLFSANRWEFDQWIREKLDGGVDLIFDRYFYSGIAYSAAKGLDLEWCKAADSGLPPGDLVFQLSLDPLLACQRPDFGAERYERVALQQAVASIFKQQFSSLPNWRCVSVDGVDAMAVHAQVISLVNGLQ